MKKYMVLLGASLLMATAQAEVKKPFNICSEIKENVAYQTMKVVKAKCDSAGVNMSEEHVYGTFMKMLSGKEASPAECNIQCMVSDAFSGKTMGDCVDNYAKTFANTIGQGHFSEATCKDFKSR